MILYSVSPLVFGGDTLGHRINAMIYGTGETQSSAKSVFCIDTSNEKVLKYVDAYLSREERVVGRPINLNLCEDGYYRTKREPKNCFECSCKEDVDKVFDKYLKQLISLENRIVFARKVFEEKLSDFLGCLKDAGLVFSKDEVVIGKVDCQLFIGHCWKDSEIKSVNDMTTVAIKSFMEKHKGVGVFMNFLFKKDANTLEFNFYSTDYDDWKRGQIDLDHVYKNDVFAQLPINY